MSTFDRRLPARFRNRNYAWIGAHWLVPTGLLLWVTIAVNPAYRWVAAALFLGSALASAFYLLSWRRADLRVSLEGVVVGGLFRVHSFPWEQIARFEIREPAKRTPFMLAFHWWSDHARLVLVDGSKLRVPALQPRHGFTALTYFTISRHTKTDTIVDWLNQLVRHKTRTDLSRRA